MTISRRGLMTSAAFTLGAMAGGAVLLLPKKGVAAPAQVIIQYDWLISNGQIGDVVALQKGFYGEAGLEVSFSPGGPNSATVPPVVTGQAALGQFSDSAQLLLARSSGIPIKIIACGFRQAPFAFYSLPKAPIRTVEDMVGKRIGIQPTARFVLDAILEKHQIDPSSLQITNIGFDMTPLVAGEVDAVTGWITNTKALSIIGPDRIDLTMKDAGVPSYANVYFATDDALENHADTLTSFIGATAKGWAWTHANQKEAADLTVDAYPQLDRATEHATMDRIMALSFDETTAKNGWGWFDPEEVQGQITLYDAIGQFQNGAPTLADSISTAILEATADLRPKIG